MPEHIATRTFIQGLEKLRLKRPVKRFVNQVQRLGIPSVVPQIVRTLPHNEEAFTQGLIVHDGWIYESTGGHTRSSLRRLDPRDGNVCSLISVKDDFAEGIAFLGNRLYQLSFKSGVARVYQLPNLNLVETLRYEGEGWGLAAFGEQLIVSDGTSRLRFYDANLRPVRTLRVHSNRIPVVNLNDLESVGDMIYANVRYTTDVVEFSAKTGRVSRIIDCSALLATVAPQGQESHLNGIAYHAGQGTFFLTGKNWPLMFEVLIPT